MDFLGIGTQKSGTSWLYQNLNRIPEFSLLPIKEVHYFDRSSDYPSPNHLSITLLTDRFRNKKWLKKAFREVWNSIVKQNWKSVWFYLKWNFSDYSDKWYLSLFKKFYGYTGEITPSYSILNQEDISRIHKLNPNVKLVLMLRNPIDRAWSHYRYSKRHKRDFDFKKVSNKDIITFMEREAQILRSDYIRMLDNYSNIFPNEQILIGFYDAIIDKPSVLLNDIVKHISGDTTISIEHLNLEKVVIG